MAKEKVTARVLRKVSAAASTTSAKVHSVAEWLGGVQLHVSARSVANAGSVLVWGIGMTFIQVDEYAAAIAIFALLSLGLLVRLKNWNGVALHQKWLSLARMSGMVVVILFFGGSIFWTNAKRGDRAWSAFGNIGLNLGPEQVRPFLATIETNGEYVEDLYTQQNTSAKVHYKNYGPEAVHDFYSSDLLYPFNVSKMTHPETLLSGIEKMVRDTHPDWLTPEVVFVPGATIGIGGSMANPMSQLATRDVNITHWQFYLVGSARWRQNGKLHQTTYCERSPILMSLHTRLQEIPWIPCDVGKPLEIPVLDLIKQ